MKKHKLLLVLLLAILLPSPAWASVFATDCPPPGQKQAAPVNYTPAQQAKDAQQQAKDTQQAAKDKQQCDTDARQIAFSHMLDRREFTYNSKKPDPNYKCPKPCCNIPVVNEEPKGCYTAPIAGFGCGKKPQEPACPLRPANLDTKSVKEHNEKIREWSKERAKYREDLSVYYDEKLKKQYQDQKDQKEKQDKEHTNRSGGQDGTNPGGGGNENGFLNPHNVK